MAISKDKDLLRLNKLKGVVDLLLADIKGNEAFYKWNNDVRSSIENIFGKGSSWSDSFSSIRYSPMIFSSDSPDSLFDECRRDGLSSATAMLSSMIEEVEEFWDDNEESVVVKNNKVFVVHGHDAGAKETVARFLEKLGLEPIILHEQANQGATLIEKFERHSNVSFAVVILTPDDLGASKGKREDLMPRARQNVVFELGYFVGKLGRKNACALYQSEIELPSDFSGIAYIDFSKESWRPELEKELKAAGFEISS